MPQPVQERPSLWRRGLNLFTAATPGVALAVPAARLVVNNAPKVAPAVIKVASGLAAPVLANPITNRVARDLSSLMMKPATAALGWAKAFDTLGSNMIQAWGVESSKHDWDKLSTPLPAKAERSDLKALSQVLTEVGPEKNDAINKLTQSYPSLGSSPEQLGRLAEAAKRMSPQQLSGFAKRVAEFKSEPGASPEFKGEVMDQVLADLANPLRPNNACGPTCSSTGAQMKMARDKPKEYADIVLDMASGRDHKLPSGEVIKATYGESTVKSLRKDNSEPASSILFQANVQHFAASKASMVASTQQNFNPLFNGGLNKLFDTVSPGSSKWVDDNFINKDFDRFNPEGGNRRVGHDPVQMEFLNKSLFPGAQTRSLLDSSPNEMWGAVERDLSQGKAVCVSVYNPTPQNPADRFHVVTVLGVDHKANPPQVKFHTWGEERSIALDDFKKSCTFVAPGGSVK